MTLRRLQATDNHDSGVGRDGLENSSSFAALKIDRPIRDMGWLENVIKVSNTWACRVSIANGTTVGSCVIEEVMSASAIIPHRTTIAPER